MMYSMYVLEEIQTDHNNIWVRKWHRTRPVLHHMKYSDSFWLFFLRKQYAPFQLIGLNFDSLDESFLPIFYKFNINIGWSFEFLTVGLFKWIIYCIMKTTTLRTFIFVVELYTETILILIFQKKTTEIMVTVLKL